MNQRWVMGLGALALTSSGWGGADLSPAWAQAEAGLTAYIIEVTSPLDGAPAADGALTLREAIELANGTLSFEALSAAEQALVQPLPEGEGSQIRFNLPAGETTIELADLLPDLVAPGLVIDGTTQPGYEADTAFDPRFPPAPVVSLTPASGQEVGRGLSIAADGVTVRGLSLYGFRTADRATQTTPPSDIFISVVAPPIDASPLSPPLEIFALEQPERAPRGVVIEQNWLGLTPAGEFPEVPSAFGVTVFNGVDAVIRQNRIEHHDGSAIITGFRAEGMRVIENAIVGNGLAGMPDAIRLEGAIAGTQIAGNLICGNDGSGIYLFKPEGASQIIGNTIQSNGRRFERAAVYVMGQDHVLSDNFIGFQPGPGVTVAAYPPSHRNLIRQNRFAQLDGLSIDLVTQGNVGVQAFQRGDGPNPPRNSPKRRQETGNGAINAPEFEAPSGVGQGDSITVAGTADPGSAVDLYRVVEADSPYSPLAEYLGTVEAGADGRFTAELELPAGSRVSAIATDPQYGTSEPAAVFTVLAADGSLPSLPAPAAMPPSCAPPEPPPPDPEPQPPEPEPAAPLQLEVPRNIHFALDRSDISPESAAVLNQIAAVLLEYPFLTVELQGHTDPRASAAYNLALSERRARAARDYLARRGVAPERMRIRPLGLTQRLSQGTSRLDYARDRRVEFIFTDTRGLEIIFQRQESDLQIE
jgi:parallel beta-helix repeat protein